LDFGIVLDIVSDFSYLIILSKFGAFDVFVEFCDLFE